MNDDRDRGMMGRPEDVRASIRAWAILIMIIAATFGAAALLFDI